jgi:hypothetical protein
MRQPQDLIFQLAVAAQKLETIKDTSRNWRLHGIDSNGLVPIEVLGIETKSEEALKKIKEVFYLLESIRKTRGGIIHELTDD